MNIFSKIKTTAPVSLLFLIVLTMGALFLFSCIDDDDDENGISEIITFERTYGSGIALDVRVTSDGGYIMIGGLEEAHSFLIKTDNAGNELWRKTFDDTNFYGSYMYHPTEHSVEETSDGGFILSVGNRVIKTDNTGNMIWQKYGEMPYGEGDDNCCRIIQTSNGNFIVAWKNGFGHHGGAGYLTLLDPDGNSIWEERFSSAFDVRELSDGGFICCGTRVSMAETHNFLVYRIDVNGNTLFDHAEYNRGEFGHALSVHNTGDNEFVAAGNILLKLDADGNTRWLHDLRKIGYGYSVRSTSDGGYFVVGNSQALYPYDYDNSTYGYYFKTDKEGMRIWLKKIEGDSTGLYSGTQTDGGGFIMTGSKHASIVLIKTDAQGNIL